MEAQQECYLFPVAAQPRERERLDQWSRALFHEFVVPIQAIPVAGLSNQAMKTACYFEISWSGRPEQTVTIMVFNAKRALNDSFTLPAWEHKAFQRGLL